jgi:myo-inositol-1(or 4)-monophosphatase
MDYRKLCLNAIDIIHKTGEYIKRESQAFTQQRVETKSHNSFVSYVDLKAEQRLVDGLDKLLPEAGFITEEETIRKSGVVFNWVIDPLDGTTNFIHGLPVYSISVALMENGKPVIGIVYEVERHETFYTWVNGAAYRNGYKINVSSSPTLSESLLATGFPYHDFAIMDSYFEILKELLPNTRGLRRMGSAAIDLAYVACGRFDAYFEYGLSHWDVAAGAFLVQQAGGVAGRFEENSKHSTGDQILASNGKIHQEILSIITEKMMASE